MVMLSDEELKNSYPKAYRHGRLACKRDHNNYFNPYLLMSNERMAFGLGWGEYCDEHKEEIFHGKENANHTLRSKKRKV